MDINPALRRLFSFIRTGVVILSALPASNLAPVTLAAESKSPLDRLVLINGDQLTGQFERMDGSTVYFKTEGLGEVKATWGKIRELHSVRILAVIEKPEKGTGDLSKARVSWGPVDVKDQILLVHTTSGTESIPVKKVGYIIDKANYDAGITKLGWLHGWTGTITAGASNVTATQNVNTYNTGISFVRSVPKAPWLNPEDRTKLDFSSTYGSISQPNTPAIETNIYHGDAEQDKYFSRDFYALAHAIFDHNSTQGLDLQQVYGGGVGYTLIRSLKQQLDFTATLDYTKQQFQTASSNQNLVGMTFGDSYSYKFPFKMVFTESAYIMPEWNNMNAYSANFSTGLMIPMFKKLSFSIQVIDSYLNDPMPGFDRNSLQINSGITYSLG